MERIQQVADVATFQDKRKQQTSTKIKVEYKQSVFNRIPQHGRSKGALSLRNPPPRILSPFFA